MTARLAVLCDVHGNATALEAVRKALKKEKPDAVIVAGDLVMNGPEPAAAVDALRAMEADGATIVQGNTDVAVADFDYAAAFPWFTDGVPDAHPRRRGVGPRRARRRAARLAAAARRRSGGSMLDDTMVLACHASPGSQTQGFDSQLDPSVVLERISRTDARVICCGHTHLPEVRDLGWKVIVNDGSAGYVFDGDPTASWALVEHRRRRR